VQQHVDLVHHQHAAAPQVEHAHNRVAHFGARHHLLALPLDQLRGAHVAVGRRRQRVRRQLLDRVQLLDELEKQRLDRLGRRAHHAAAPPRHVELGENAGDQLAAVVDGALKLQRVHLLDNDRGEARAQHVARLLEQRRRHHVHHQLLAVGQHQRQQRADHRRLAGAHDHLLHRVVVLRLGRRRAAAPHVGDEAAHNLDLAPPQHDVENVLEHDEARVERAGVDVVAPRHQLARQRRRGVPHLVGVVGRLARCRRLAAMSLMLVAAAAAQLQQRAQRTRARHRAARVRDARHAKRHRRHREQQRVDRRLVNKRIHVAHVARAARRQQRAGDEAGVQRRALPRHALQREHAARRVGSRRHAIDCRQNVRERLLGVRGVAALQREQLGLERQQRRARLRRLAQLRHALAVGLRRVLRRVGVHARQNVLRDRRARRRVARQIANGSAPRAFSPLRSCHSTRRSTSITLLSGMSANAAISAGAQHAGRRRQLHALARRVG
jgi:hypothetical protein